jgi:hypothetical protein
MPPHPNFPCHRCSRQFGSDETMFMVPVGRNRNPKRLTATVPICEACATPEERGVAAGQSWSACLGCRRLMAPAVSSFRRSTCSDACQARVERRRLPPPPPLPSRTCATCQRRFTPGRRGTGAVEVKFCSTKCRTRAKDDRKLAFARATRDHQRVCASCGKPFTPTRSNHHACGHVCAQRIRRAKARDDRRLALERAKRGRRGHPSSRLPRIAMIGA